MSDLENIGRQLAEALARRASMLGDWQGYTLVPDIDSASTVLASGGRPLIVPLGSSLASEQLSEAQQNQWERPGRIFGRFKEGGYGLLQRDDVGRIDPLFEALYNEEAEGPRNQNTQAGFGGLLDNLAGFR